MVGAVVDCLVALALSSPGLAAGGVLVFVVPSTSARLRGLVVVAVSATAGLLALLLAVCAAVNVGAESAIAVGTRARRGDTVAFWGATVGSETTEADKAEAADRAEAAAGAAAGVIAACAGWAVVGKGTGRL